MSKDEDLAQAVTHDLSQDFRTSEEIRRLVEALGSPAELALAGNLDNPGAFWLNTFKPWLASDFETNRKFVNEAFRRYYPDKALPGTPTIGNQAPS